MKKSWSACLFLQGRPPQDQTPATQKHLAWSPSTSVSNPRIHYFIFFISIWSSNILASTVSYYSLFFPTGIALLPSDPAFDGFVFQDRHEEGQLLCEAIPACQAPKGEVPHTHCTNFLETSSICTWLESLILFSWLPFLLSCWSFSLCWQCFCFGEPNFYF